VLADKGLIEERMETQMYSHEDGDIASDRYIEGTCPGAALNQHAAISVTTAIKQLDPVDLINRIRQFRFNRIWKCATRFNVGICCNPKAENDIEDWIDSQTGWPRLTSRLPRNG
jgi:methionyl-tRNA synthetase